MMMWTRLGTLLACVGLLAVTYTHLPGHTPTHVGRDKTGVLREGNNSKSRARLPHLCSPWPDCGVPHCEPWPTCTATATSHCHPWPLCSCNRHCGDHLEDQPWPTCAQTDIHADQPSPYPWSICPNLVCEFPELAETAGIPEANVSATCLEQNGTETFPCHAGSCLDGHGAGLPVQANSTTPAPGVGGSVTTITTTPIQTLMDSNPANATNATSSTKATALEPSNRTTMDPSDAAALAGTVSTVVGAVIAGVVAATASGAIPPNPGAMALIGQVQVLSQIGRIGGGGGGAMGAFSDGFAWAHGNGLYTMFPNPDPDPKGNGTRRRSFRRQQENEPTDGLSPMVGKTAGEASGDCDAPELTERERAKCLECGVIDGAPMLDKLVGIVVSLGVVFLVRFSAQFIVTKCLKKEPWTLLMFPNWEGPLLLTHWFSMCDSLTSTLGRPCTFWVILSCVLLFFGPIFFIMYAMWSIARNLRKGLMTYEAREKISFKETREKFSEAGTLRCKWKAISEYYDRRRHKGDWNENTQQGKFWRFLVKDFSAQAWKYCVWLLIRKFLFAAAMALTIGAANAGAVIVLHIFDVGVLTLMNPFCDNVFQGSEMLSACSNLVTMILVSMPVLHGDIPEALSDFFIICCALAGTVMALVAAVVTPILGVFGAVFGLCMSAMPDGLGAASAGGASGALFAAAANIQESVQELLEDSMEEIVADGEVEGDRDMGRDAALLGVGAAAVGGAAYYAYTRSQGLRDAMDTSCTTAHSTLTLGLEFNAAGEEGSSERQVFVNQLVQDLANASEVAATRFDVKKMSPGSIVVDLDIVADPTGKGPDSASVVHLLEEQAANPASLLRKGSVTCHTQRICVNGLSVPVGTPIDEQAFCSDVKQGLGKTPSAVENSSTAFARIQGDMPPKRAVPAPPSLRVTAAAATLQDESIEIMMESEAKTALGENHKESGPPPGSVRREDEWALSLARRRKLLSIFSHWRNCELGKPLTRMETRASGLALRRRLAWFFDAWYCGISNRRIGDLIEAGGVMTRHFDVFGSAFSGLAHHLAAKILRKWADCTLGYSSIRSSVRLKVVYYRRIIDFQEAVSKGRSTTCLKHAMIKWLWKTREFGADEATADALSPSDVRNEIYVSSPPVHMYRWGSLALQRSDSDDRLSASSPAGSVFSKRSSKHGFTCNDVRVDVVEPVTGYEPENTGPERSPRRLFSGSVESLATRNDAGSVWIPTIRSGSFSQMASLTRNIAGLERSPRIHSGSFSNVESLTRSSIYGSHVKSHKAHTDLEACDQPPDSESRASRNSAGEKLAERTVVHGEGTFVNVSANAAPSASPQQLNGLISDLIGAALIGPQFLDQKLRCLSRSQSSLSNIVARLEEGFEEQDVPVLTDSQSVSPWGVRAPGILRFISPRESPVGERIMDLRESQLGRAW
jgi:hypothetical protein